MRAVGTEALRCVIAGKIDSGATVSVSPGHGQRQLAGARIAVSTGLTQVLRLQEKGSQMVLLCSPRPQVCVIHRGSVYSCSEKERSSGRD